MRDKNKRTTIEISKDRQKELRELSKNLRWSYDSLIEDMIAVYQTKKASEDMGC